MRVAAFVLGLVLTLWTFWAMVLAMLVPHGRTNVVASSVQGFVWTMARIPLRAMRSYRLQDRWLAGVAPLSIILQLVLYAIILIFTLGLMVYGLTDLSFGDSLYQSGSTFTTLGIVEPVNVPSNLTVFLAAFLGLVVIAIFIGYLMGTYSAFVTREAQMTRIELLAGEPAWGPQILIRGQLIGLPIEELPEASSWTDWITSVRMNQLVNSALGDFRSTSPWRHWTTTLLAVLDAAAIQLACAPKGAQPRLIELLTQGTALLRSMSSTRRTTERMPNWQIESAMLDVLADRGEPSADPHVTREDFDDAVEELRAAGIVLPGDLDAIWRRFRAIRAQYAPYAVALAIRHHAVRSPWSGPRQPQTPVVWPERAGQGIQ